MSTKSALYIAFSCLFGGSVIVPASREKMHQWIIEMHLAQIELLNIDWGQPGFCTKWDRDYDSTTRSCRNRGEFTEREFLK